MKDIWNLFSFPLSIVIWNLFESGVCIQSDSMGGDVDTPYNGDDGSGIVMPMDSSENSSERNDV